MVALCSKYTRRVQDPAAPARGALETEHHARKNKQLKTKRRENEVEKKTEKKKEKEGEGEKQRNRCYPPMLKFNSDGVHEDTFSEEKYPVGKMDKRRQICKQQENYHFE